MTFALSLIPIVLSIATIVRLDFNFHIMLLVTILTYLVVSIWLILRLRAANNQNKLLPYFLWFIMSIVLFPFGCLIILIINWKKLNN